MLKNGEIRVLRDSLKAAQQEKETQKQNQIVLDTQKQKEQSAKEKELNKKARNYRAHTNTYSSKILLTIT